MRANPAAGWLMSDIEAVCREHGVLMAEKLTIPYNRPIKPIYIRKLVAFLDAVRVRE
jgi:hypothetical protein